MKALLAFIFILFLSLHLYAQVNAYAKVTAISSTTLTISTSNETYATFISGLPVIVMQMQDNTIGSNTSNSTSFGSLSSILSTGEYEVAHISSVTRSAGAITQITLTSPLANTYGTGSNSSVQLISYPLMGSTNYTTTADITAVPWNGSIGGVVAFRVSGTLTLNHNITADAAGFRGATANAGNAGSCDNVTYITGANEYNASKGEGIYKVTNTSYAAGRGRILNGGGGGNSHNGGGGGGSNASTGGEGGKGYSCASNAGGLGGITLYPFVSSSRVFMGGGGGAGEANNSYNTAGGNGGGIIIINANHITTTGTGSALRISANGETASDVGNDGAGGAGAGGTVMLKVNSWNIASTKTLTISANGGAGGNVTDAAAHGGGGGGGQGAVIFSTATPTTNITSRTLNGAGGRNNAGGTFAESGGGSDNAAIFNSSFGLLPTNILSFKGKKSNSDNLLNWQMVHESEVEYYEVQRSGDGSNFQTIERVNKQSELYHFADKNVDDGNFYYRIAIHSANHVTTYSSVVLIRSANLLVQNVSLLPNPVHQHATVVVDARRSSFATISIVNPVGVTVKTQTANLIAGENRISFGSLALISGTYQVIVNAGGVSSSIKMLVLK
jgi:hypothetical protein